MKELVCILCPKGCHLRVDEQNGYAVTGNTCPRGAAYGKKELTFPTRTLTSTVVLQGGVLPRLPVKTRGEIPKSLMMQAITLLDGLVIQAPVKLGQVVVKNILGTGISFVATRSMGKAAPR